MAICEGRHGGIAAGGERGASKLSQHDLDTGTPDLQATDRMVAPAIQIVISFI